MHHFSGTYGTIIIYEGNETNNNFNELDTILNSNVLNKRPLVLIFDKSKLGNKDYIFIEEMRFNLLKRNIKFNIQFIDFSNNDANTELFYGLDWLFNEINSK